MVLIQAAAWASYERSFESYKRAWEAYENRNFQEALDWANRAVEENRENVDALTLKGEILYLQGDLSGAQRVLTEARQRAGQDARRAAIEQKLAKIAVEESIEKDLTTFPHGIFEIRQKRGQTPFGEKGSDPLSHLVTALGRAKEALERDFRHVPRRRIAVVLYPEEEFRKIRELPHGLLGLYDGKIRLPIYEKPTGEPVEAILMHEYSHAVVDDLAEGKVPIWLNEGLAKYEEAKVKPVDLEPVWRARSEGKLVLLISLLDPIFLRGKQVTLNAGLFYTEAYLLVRYLIERWGVSTLREVMLDYKAGRSTDEILRQRYGYSAAELETNWLRWLKTLKGSDPYENIN